MKRAVMASVTSLACVAASLAGVIHVDDDAKAGGDGQSWQTAFKYLQDALWIAQSGDEIRVAQGTYLPDRDEAGLVTVGDREAAFALVSGVTTAIT